MSPYEKEVTINFDDGEETARVFAASPVWMRKLDKLCRLYPENFKRTDECKLNGKTIGCFYEFDKNLITIRSKRQTCRMTDDQKRRASERLKAIREKRKVESNTNK